MEISLQAMPNRYPPISLVARQPLLNFLDIVAWEQRRLTDRVSLANPIDEIIACYESKKLRDVGAVAQGLLLRITNALAKRASSFTVFRAIAVPMPPPEQEKAIKWKLKASYLAIFDITMTQFFKRVQPFKRCWIYSLSDLCRYD